MMFKVSEKFKSVQGEGVYAGTPMAFIRLVGCSVGKRICQHCDTDFEEMHSWRGGGEFTAAELMAWVRETEHTHVCLTGGEPLNWALDDFFSEAPEIMFHVETSGTVPLPTWMVDMLGYAKRRLWVCVSPKPGFREDVVKQASEVKVIVPGLGDITPSLLMKLQLDYDTPEARQALMNNPPHWPTLEDALRWADAGKVVFLQPRNARYDIDANNLRIVQDVVAANPTLRLSVQLHKILKVQ